MKSQRLQLELVRLVHLRSAGTQQQKHNITCEAPVCHLNWLRDYTVFPSSIHIVSHSVSNAMDRLEARGNNSGSGNNANSNVGSSSRALHNTFNRTSMLVVILSKVNGR